MPITPGGWRRKAREGRSASRREDPIHLGAATRQRGGAIRRAERRRQWAEAWEPRSGSALAETGRLSASERPSKVRNRKNRPKRLVAWTQRSAGRIARSRYWRR